MDISDTCINKPYSFNDLEIRAKKYFKESGFDKFESKTKKSETNSKNKI
jgi:hypothetical protein